MYTATRVQKAKVQGTPVKTLCTPLLIALLTNLVPRLTVLNAMR